MAGGRYNSATQSNYGPIEGELLGMGSALQRTRYFIASHPKVQVITGHLPLVNLLSDRSRRIDNKRLTNLRRKCDDYHFKIGYGKGVEKQTQYLGLKNEVKQKMHGDFQRLETMNILMRKMRKI